MSSSRLGISKLCFRLSQSISELKSVGTYKDERIITTPQSVHVKIFENSDLNLINFCSNNYLGFASHPDIVNASSNFTKKYGAGLSSVRFICGTQDIHKMLESKVSQFHNREDSICYISCFDANTGLFEAILGPEDVIISDQLNHASIIDGIRLCKAKKAVYEHRNMNDLESKLKQNRGARNILIATDGVFSMDGNVAPLKDICDLAQQYGATTFVDDCHATGFFGATGRGTEEYLKILGRVDIINSTFGKALGGACGGYTTGPKILIDWLRQKSRPYLFSNSIPPSVVGASLKAIELVDSSQDSIKKLATNTQLFRSCMKQAGFNLIGSNHPICPVMIPDEPTAVKFAKMLLDEGIYVIGFTYPVVPLGQARIRVQISAIHSEKDIMKCVEAFEKVGIALKVI